MAFICIKPMVELARKSKKPIIEGNIRLETTILRNFISGTTGNATTASRCMKMKDGLFRSIFFGTGLRRRSARSA
jgi:hypothetical protein